MSGSITPNGKVVHGVLLYMLDTTVFQTKPRNDLSGPAGRDFLLYPQPELKGKLVARYPPKQPKAKRKAFLRDPTAIDPETGEPYIEDSFTGLLGKNGNGDALDSVIYPAGIKLHRTPQPTTCHSFLLIGAKSFSEAAQGTHETRKTTSTDSKTDPGLLYTDPFCHDHIEALPSPPDPPPSQPYYGFAITQWVHIPKHYMEYLKVQVSTQIHLNEDSSGFEEPLPSTPQPVQVNPFITQPNTESVTQPPTALFAPRTIVVLAASNHFSAIFEALIRVTKDCLFDVDLCQYVYHVLSCIPTLLDRGASSFAVAQRAEMKRAMQRRARTSAKNNKNHYHHKDIPCPEDGLTELPNGAYRGRRAVIRSVNIHDTFMPHYDPQSIYIPHIQFLHEQLLPPLLTPTPQMQQVNSALSSVTSAHLNPQSPRTGQHTPINTVGSPSSTTKKKKEQGREQVFQIGLESTSTLHQHISPDIISSPLNLLVSDGETPRSPTSAAQTRRGHEIIFQTEPQILFNHHYAPQSSRPLILTPLSGLPFYAPYPMSIAQTLPAFVFPQYPYNTAPLVDPLEYYILLKHLSPSIIIHIITAIFSQIGVLVISDDISLITPSLQAIISLLYPFQFTTTYIPLLSSLTQTELLDNFQAFLYGAHSSILENDTSFIGTNFFVVHLNRNTIVYRSGDLGGKILPAPPPIPKLSGPVSNMARKVIHLFKFDSNYEFSELKLHKVRMKRQQQTPIALFNQWINKYNDNLNTLIKKQYPRGRNRISISKKSETTLAIDRKVESSETNDKLDDWHKIEKPELKSTQLSTLDTCIYQFGYNYVKPVIMQQSSSSALNLHKSPFSSPFQNTKISGLTNHTVSRSAAFTNYYNDNGSNGSVNNTITSISNIKSKGHRMFTGLFTSIYHKSQAVCPIHGTQHLIQLKAPNQLKMTSILPTKFHQYDSGEGGSMGSYSAQHVHNINRITDSSGSIMIMDDPNLFDNDELDVEYDDIGRNGNDMYDEYPIEAYSTSNHSQNGDLDIEANTDGIFVNLANLTHSESVSIAGDDFVDVSPQQSPRGSLKSLANTRHACCTAAQTQYTQRIAAFLKQSILQWLTTRNSTHLYSDYLKYGRVKAFRQISTNSTSPSLQSSQNTSLLQVSQLAEDRFNNPLNAPLPQSLAEVADRDLAPLPEMLNLSSPPLHTLAATLPYELHQMCATCQYRILGYKSNANNAPLISTTPQSKESGIYTLDILLDKQKRQTLVSADILKFNLDRLRFDSPFSSIGEIGHNRVDCCISCAHDNIYPIGLEEILKQYTTPSAMKLNTYFHHHNSTVGSGSSQPLSHGSGNNSIHPIGAHGDGDGIDDCGDLFAKYGVDDVDPVLEDADSNPISSTIQQAILQLQRLKYLQTAFNRGVWGINNYNSYILSSLHGLDIHELNYAEFDSSIQIVQNAYILPLNQPNSSSSVTNIHHIPGSIADSKSYTDEHSLFDLDQIDPTANQHKNTTTSLPSDSEGDEDNDDGGDVNELHTQQPHAFEEGDTSQKDNQTIPNYRRIPWRLAVRMYLGLLLAAVQVRSALKMTFPPDLGNIDELPHAGPHAEAYVHQQATQHLTKTMIAVVDGTEITTTTTTTPIRIRGNDSSSPSQQDFHARQSFFAERQKLCRQGAHLLAEKVELGTNLESFFLFYPLLSTTILNGGKIYPSQPLPITGPPKRVKKPVLIDPTDLEPSNHPEKEDLLDFLQLDPDAVLQTDQFEQSANATLFPDSDSDADTSDEEEMDFMEALTSRKRVKRRLEVYKSRFKFVNCEIIMVMLPDFFLYKYESCGPLNRDDNSHLHSKALYFVIDANYNIINVFIDHSEAADSVDLHTNHFDSLLPLNTNSPSGNPQQIAPPDPLANAPLTIASPSSENHTPQRRGFVKRLFNVSSSKKEAQETSSGSRLALLDQLPTNTVPALVSAQEPQLIQHFCAIIDNARSERLKPHLIQYQLQQVSNNFAQNAQKSPHSAFSRPLLSPILSHSSSSNVGSGAIVGSPHPYPVTPQRNPAINLDKLPICQQPSTKSFFQPHSPQPSGFTITVTPSKSSALDETPKKPSVDSSQPQNQNSELLLSPYHPSTSLLSPKPAPIYEHPQYSNATLKTPQITPHASFQAILSVDPVQVATSPEPTPSMSPTAALSELPYHMHSLLTQNGHFIKSYLPLDIHLPHNITMLHYAGLEPVYVTPFALQDQLFRLQRNPDSQLYIDVSVNIRESAHESPGSSENVHQSIPTPQQHYVSQRGIPQGPMKPFQSLLFDVNSSATPSQYGQISTSGSNSLLFSSSPSSSRAQQQLPLTQFTQSPPTYHIPPQYIRSAHLNFSAAQMHPAVQYSIGGGGYAPDFGDTSSMLTETISMSSMYTPSMTNNTMTDSFGGMNQLSSPGVSLDPKNISILADFHNPGNATGLDSPMMSPTLQSQGCQQHLISPRCQQSQQPQQCPEEQNKRTPQQSPQTQAQAEIVSLGNKLTDVIKLSDFESCLENRILSPEDVLVTKRTIDVLHSGSDECHDYTDITRAYYGNTDSLTDSDTERHLDSLTLQDLDRALNYADDRCRDDDLMREHFRGNKALKKQGRVGNTGAGMSLIRQRSSAVVDNRNGDMSDYVSVVHSSVVADGNPDDFVQVLHRTASQYSQASLPDNVKPDHLCPNHYLHVHPLSTFPKLPIQLTQETPFSQYPHLWRVSPHSMTPNPICAFRSTMLSSYVSLFQGYWLAFIDPDRHSQKKVKKSKGNKKQQKLEEPTQLTQTSSELNNEEDLPTQQDATVDTVDNPPQEQEWFRIQLREISPHEHSCNVATLVHNTHDELFKSYLGFFTKDNQTFSYFCSQRQGILVSSESIRTWRRQYTVIRKVFRDRKRQQLFVRLLQYYSTQYQSNQSQTDPAGAPSIPLSIPKQQAPHPIVYLQPTNSTSAATVVPKLFDSLDLTPTPHNRCCYNIDCDCQFLPASSFPNISNATNIAQHSPQDQHIVDSISRPLLDPLTRECDVPEQHAVLFTGLLNRIRAQPLFRGVRVPDWFDLAFLAKQQHYANRLAEITQNVVFSFLKLRSQGNFTTSWNQYLFELGNNAQGTQLTFYASSSALRETEIDYKRSFATLQYINKQLSLGSALPRESLIFFTQKKNDYKNKIAHLRERRAELRMEHKVGFIPLIEGATVISIPDPKKLAGQKTPTPYCFEVIVGIDEHAYSHISMLLNSNQSNSSNHMTNTPFIDYGQSSEPTVMSRAVLGNDKRQQALYTLLSKQMNANLVDLWRKQLELFLSTAQDKDTTNLMQGVLTECLSLLTGNTSRRDTILNWIYEYDTFLYGPTNKHLVLFYDLYKLRIQQAWEVINYHQQTKKSKDIKDFHMSNPFYVHQTQFAYKYALNKAPFIQDNISFNLFHDVKHSLQPTSDYFSSLNVPLTAIAAATTSTLSAASTAGTPGSTSAKLAFNSTHGPLSYLSTAQNNIPYLPVPLLINDTFELFDTLVDNHAYIPKLPITLTLDTLQKSSKSTFIKTIITQQHTTGWLLVKTYSSTVANTVPNVSQAKKHCINKYSVLDALSEKALYAMSHGLLLPAMYLQNPLAALMLANNKLMTPGNTSQAIKLLQDHVHYSFFSLSGYQHDYTVSRSPIYDQYTGTLSCSNTIDICPESTYVDPDDEPNSIISNVKKIHPNSITKRDVVLDVRAKPDYSPMEVSHMFFMTIPLHAAMLNPVTPLVQSSQAVNHIIAPYLSLPHHFPATLDDAAYHASSERESDQDMLLKTGQLYMNSQGHVSTNPNGDQRDSKSQKKSGQPPITNDYQRLNPMNKKACAGTTGITQAEIDVLNTHGFLMDNITLSEFLATPPAQVYHTAPQTNTVSPSTQTYSPYIVTLPLAVNSLRPSVKQASTKVKMSGGSRTKPPHFMRYTDIPEAVRMLRSLLWPIAGYNNILSIEQAKYQNMGNTARVGSTFPSVNSGSNYLQLFAQTLSALSATKVDKPIDLLPTKNSSNMDETLANCPPLCDSPDKNKEYGVLQPPSASIPPQNEDGGIIEPSVSYDDCTISPSATAIVGSTPPSNVQRRGSISAPKDKYLTNLKDLILPLKNLDLVTNPSSILTEHSTPLPTLYYTASKYISHIHPSILVDLYQSCEKSLDSLLIMGAIASYDDNYKIQLQSQILQEHGGVSYSANEYLLSSAQSAQRHLNDSVNRNMLNLSSASPSFSQNPGKSAFTKMNTNTPTDALSLLVYIHDKTKASIPISYILQQKQQEQLQSQRLCAANSTLITTSLQPTNTQNSLAAMGFQGCTNSPSIRSSMNKNPSVGNQGPVYRQSITIPSHHIPQAPPKPHQYPRPHPVSPHPPKDEKRIMSSFMLCAEDAKTRDAWIQAISARTVIHTHDYITFVKGVQPNKAKKQNSGHKRAKGEYNYSQDNPVRNIEHNEVVVAVNNKQAQLQAKQQQLLKDKETIYSALSKYVLFDRDTSYAILLALLHLGQAIGRQDNVWFVISYISVLIRSQNHTKGDCLEWCLRNSATSPAAAVLTHILSNSPVDLVVRQATYKYNLFNTPFIKYEYPFSAKQFLVFHSSIHNLHNPSDIYQLISPFALMGGDLLPNNPTPQPQTASVTVGALSPNSSNTTGSFFPRQSQGFGRYQPTSTTNISKKQSLYYTMCKFTWEEDAQVVQAFLSAIKTEVVNNILKCLYQIDPANGVYSFIEHRMPRSGMCNGKSSKTSDFTDEEYDSFASNDEQKTFQTCICGCCKDTVYNGTAAIMVYFPYVYRAICAAIFEHLNILHCIVITLIKQHYFTIYHANREVNALNKPNNNILHTATLSPQSLYRNMISLLLLSTTLTPQLGPYNLFLYYIEQTMIVCKQIQRSYVLTNAKSRFSLWKLTGMEFVLFITRVLSIEPSMAVRLALIAADLGVLYNHATVTEVALQQTTDQKHKLYQSIDYVFANFHSFHTTTTQYTGVDDNNIPPSPRMGSSSGDVLILSDSLAASNTIGPAAQTPIQVSNLSLVTTNPVDSATNLLLTPHKCIPNQSSLSSESSSTRRMKVTRERDNITCSLRSPVPGSDLHQTQGKLFSHNAYGTLRVVNSQMEDNSETLININNLSISSSQLSPIASPGMGAPSTPATMFFSKKSALQGQSSNESLNSPQQSLSTTNRFPFAQNQQRLAEIPAVSPTHASSLVYSTQTRDIYHKQITILAANTYFMCSPSHSYHYTKGFVPVSNTTLYLKQQSYESFCLNVSFLHALCYSQHAIPIFKAFWVQSPLFDSPYTCPQRYLNPLHNNINDINMSTGIIPPQLQHPQDVQMTSPQSSDDAAPIDPASTAKFNSSSSSAVSIVLYTYNYPNNQYPLPVVIPSDITKLYQTGLTSSRQNFSFAGHHYFNHLTPCACSQILQPTTIDFVIISILQQSLNTLLTKKLLQTGSYTHTLHSYTLTFTGHHGMLILLQQERICSNERDAMGILTRLLHLNMISDLDVVEQNYLNGMHHAGEQYKLKCDHKRPLPQYSSSNNALYVITPHNLYIHGDLTARDLELLTASAESTRSQHRREAITPKDDSKKNRFRLKK